MPRAPGTYYTFDKDVLHTIIQRMPAKEGILTYLAAKQSFDIKGATKGELIDVLACSSKTLERAFSQLKKAGDIREEDGRFFPNVSPTLGTSVGTTLGTSVGESPQEEPVQDVAPEPLKEKKDLKEKEEKPTTPPTPPKHAVPPPTLQQSRHILVDSYFDTWQKVQAIARDKDFKDQQTTAVCQQVLALIDKHGTRAVNEALDEALRGLADIRRPFAWLPKRLEGREQVQQQTESHHERLARERREREAEIERLIAEINGD